MSKGGRKNAKSLEKKSDSNAVEKENIGNRLRRLRTEKGLSTRDVCEATRISETNLNAIEEQNFSALPADTFIRGLLAIYAEFLGENPTETVDAFMEARDESHTRERRGRAKMPGSVMTPRKLAEPTHVSSITMAAVLLVLIVALFTGFCVYTSWNPFSFLMEKSGNIQSIVTDMIPESQSPAPVAVPGEMSGASQPETAPGVRMAFDVTVRFLADTGVEIQRDADEIIRQSFSAGDVANWESDSALVLTFDTPASASIVVNGVPVAFPSEKDGRYTLRIPEDLPDSNAHD